MQGAIRCRLRVVCKSGKDEETVKVETGAANLHYHIRTYSEE